MRGIRHRLADAQQVRFNGVTSVTSSFTTYRLGDGCEYLLGRLPNCLMPTLEGIDAIWSLHPHSHAEILIHGKQVSIPRWQQAYGHDYMFNSVAAHAHPMPALLTGFLAWTQQTVDDRLNGALVNWYDGALGHYLGPHHDKTRGLVEGLPIVTISLGEERVFRFSHKDCAAQDILLESGSVLILPWHTNLKWKHGIPRLTRYRGRRISVTFRAFA
jgi:alkylated DNA repair dioxygenase AlkB